MWNEFWKRVRAGRYVPAQKAAFKTMRAQLKEIFDDSKQFQSSQLDACLEGFLATFKRFVEDNPHLKVSLSDVEKLEHELVLMVNRKVKLVQQDAIQGANDQLEGQAQAQHSLIQTESDAQQQQLPAEVSRAIQ